MKKNIYFLIPDPRYRVYAVLLHYADSVRFIR